MKAISTKYIGPGNVRGSRFKATDGDGNSITVSYNYALNADKNHMMAAVALAEKMGWTGTLIQGSTKEGYVHVWLDGGEMWCIPPNPTPAYKAMRSPAASKQGR
jgi:hypothetical protein